MGVAVGLLLLMMNVVSMLVLFGLTGSVVMGVDLIYLMTGLIIFMAVYLVMLTPEDFYLEAIFFIDGLSLILTILSLWITLLMVFSSYSVIRFKEFSNFFVSLMIMLLLILAITFFSGSFILFYFFFEISLIPTLMIIMGWGYQPERLQAGVYFLFYTLTASLPLLLLVIFMYLEEGSTVFGLLLNSLKTFSLSDSVIFLAGVMGSMAFLVKLPMYFIHLWLPSAHVEAPVAGSMILAGVLLKLGGYGLMRILWISMRSVKSFSPYLMGLSLIGMLYVGFMCCRVNDFKALVAYSSVAHMALVVGGLMTFFNWGFIGGTMMMVAHGISSSGLFCIVNMYYERTSSRSFFINSGLILVLPLFSMFMFLLSASNIGAPPSINLLSEIFLMTSIMSYSYVMMLIFPLGTFLGAVLTLFMYSFSQHGSIYYMSLSISVSNYREMMILALHVVPVNFLILNPSLLMG